MNIIKKLFGTTSEREIKKINHLLDKIDGLESDYSSLSDEELRSKTEEFRGRLKSGETLDDILPEAFAVVREASKRVTGMRPYRVQMIGGIILHQGRIAEMKTGEGKTLVAVMPSYLNALSGKSSHVITVNDYLATRDSEEMGRIHKFLGLTVGVLTHDTPITTRKEIYTRDIVYGTNAEFGFDYLRDNMAPNRELMVQNNLNFAIIDEVDSILIDEARTPLIISGTGDKSTEVYKEADNFAKKLNGLKVEEHDTKCDVDEYDSDYVIDEKHKSILITSKGYAKIEKHFKIDNCADPQNASILHHVTQAIRANGYMVRDKDYIVDYEKDQIIIIDEFTGRLMYGRRYNNGLHQAIEAKEGLEVKRESVTLATITLQNYFRMYSKISGMTGTAKTEEQEFKDIYGLDVVEIPTNKPMIREDQNDRVYMTLKYKEQAIINKIKECNKTGQPILVGTTSVENSERISKLLKPLGIRHNVLNAKNHRQEAEIVAAAGRFGAVTIATNMAGRGTDIILGGNPEKILEGRVRRFDYKSILSKSDIERYDELYQELRNLSISNLQELKNSENPLIAKAIEIIRESKDSIYTECAENREKVLEVGGLFILGTERHESRRIDNQLRGRSGRQGDPGKSLFMLSLEDELLRVFGGDRVKSLASLSESLGVGAEPLSAKALSSVVENAQKRLEGVNFQSRKTVLQFDDVVNKQRDIIYGQRRKVMMSDNVHEDIVKMIRGYVDEHMNSADPMQSVEEYPVFKTIYDDDTWEFKETGEGVIADFQKNLIDYCDKKFGDLPESLRNGFEAHLLLSNVDTNWREHIDAMAELQKGIVLRGYAQEDPIIAYQNEAFDMFNYMVSNIRRSVVEQLILIQYDFQAVVPTGLQKK